MKLNKKGLSIIEIIISIVLISTITILMYRFLSDVTYQKDNEYFASANQETKIDILTYIPNNVKNFFRIVTDASGNCTRMGDTTTCEVSSISDASENPSYQVIIDKLGERYYIDFKDANNTNNNKRWELKQVTGYKVVVNNSLDLVQTINIEIYTNNDDNKENNNNTLDDINIVLKNSDLMPEPAPTEFNLTVDGGKAYKDYPPTTEYAKDKDGSYYIVAPDEIVYLLANSESGKEFKNWIPPEGVTITNPNSNNTARFVMPHSDVLITAAYNNLYNLSITNGALYSKGCSTEMTALSSGNTRTYTLTENQEFCIKTKDLPSGAIFSNWTATNITIPNTTSETNDNLKMPAKSVTITANYDISYDLSVTNGVVCTTSACSSYQATTSSSGTTNIYSIKVGSTVYIKSSLTSPKEFDHWQVQYGTSLANTTSAQTSFTMPNHAERVEAVPKTELTLTVKKGKAYTSSSYSTEVEYLPESTDYTRKYVLDPGKTVYIKANDEDKFDKWTTNPNSGSGISNTSSAKTTLTMPNKNVIIEANNKIIKMIQVIVSLGTAYKDSSYTTELSVISEKTTCKVYRVEENTTIYLSTDINYADRVNKYEEWLRSQPFKGWVRNKIDASGKYSGQTIGYSKNLSYKLGTINEEFSPKYYDSVTNTDFYMIGMNTYKETGSLQCGK